MAVLPLFRRGGVRQVQHKPCHHNGEQGCQWLRNHGPPRLGSQNKEVNLKNIDGLDLVTIETLKENKIISKAVKKVKIFGTFDLTSKLNVEGIKVTKGAKESIEKAGGNVAEITAPVKRPKGIKKTERDTE